MTMNKYRPRHKCPDCGRYHYCKLLYVMRPTVEQHYEHGIFCTQTGAYHIKVRSYADGRYLKQEA